MEFRPRMCAEGVARPPRWGGRCFAISGWAQGSTRAGGAGPGPRGGEGVDLIPPGFRCATRRPKVGVKGGVEERQRLRLSNGEEANCLWNVYCLRKADVDREKLSI